MWSAPIKLQPLPDDPYHNQPKRWIGATARFDLNGKRLVGVVMSHVFTGRTAKGNIPDYEVTIRGQSGAVLTVSMHKTYMDIEWKL